MPTCKELGIPKRLWKRGLPDKTTFKSGEELLYRWYPANTKLAPDGKIPEAALGSVFKHPADISCNRSSLCLYSTDVLYKITEPPQNRFNCGVIETAVKKINGHSFKCSYEQDGKTHVVKIDLKLKHSPEECMYPHTVIECYKDGVLIDEDEIKPKNFRKVMRQNLAPLFNVCHYADPNFTPPEETRWQYLVATIEPTFKKILRIN